MNKEAEQEIEKDIKSEHQNNTSSHSDTGNSNNTETKNDDRLAELYEKLAQSTRDLFEKSSDKTTSALSSAIEGARAGLEKAGDVSKQESEKLKGYLRKDLEHASTRIDEITGKTKKKVEPAVKKAEDGFLNLTSLLAHSASDAFGRLADWADSAAAYHTGQVTSPGSLQCLNCGKEMNFKKTGNIPPCPSCRKTDFKKVS